MINSFHFIIYVKDQKKSVDFYKKVLKIDPFLDVPGMTEFKISQNSVFGIMPEVGISRILENKVDFSSDNQIKCELYLVVDNPSESIEEFKSLGGKIISDVKLRNWGCNVGYGMDFDGNVIAFSN
ncbi:MAG: VOC family protein [Candidatus Muiribacteriota bacterium]